MRFSCKEEDVAWVIQQHRRNDPRLQWHPNVGAWQRFGIQTNGLWFKLAPWHAHRAYQALMLASPCSTWIWAPGDGRHSGRLTNTADSATNLQTCAKCLRKQPRMSHCQGCCLAYYCGEGTTSRCQRQDWTNHKTLCRWVQSVIARSTAAYGCHDIS